MLEEGSAGSSCWHSWVGAEDERPEIVAEIVMAVRWEAVEPCSVGRPKGEARSGFGETKGETIEVAGWEAGVEVEREGQHRNEEVVGELKDLALTEITHNEASGEGDLAGIEEASEAAVLGQHQFWERRKKIRGSCACWTASPVGVGVAWVEVGVAIKGDWERNESVWFRFFLFVFLFWSFLLFFSLSISVFCFPFVFSKYSLEILWM